MNAIHSSEQANQTRYQVRDRLSARTVSWAGAGAGGLGDRVPEAKTVWLYREALVQAGKMEEVFALFDGHLARRGHIARGGQILDVERAPPPVQARPRGIVPVLCPHNKRAENAAIKAGEVPEGRADEPAKRSQKNVDARWSEVDQKTVRGSVFPTSKHGTSHYGTRNQINVDRKHQLIRHYHVTDAAVHDSQAVDALLTRGNTGSGVWADAAWRSAGIETAVRASKLTSHIHRKDQRGKPLTGQAQKSNRTKSTLRVRVAHIFGAQVVEPGGVLVRTIGVASGCSNRWRDRWRLLATAGDCGPRPGSGPRTSPATCGIWVNCAA